MTSKLGADPDAVKMALQAVACLGEPTAEYDYEGWLILGGEVRQVVEVGGCDEDDGYRTYTVVCTVDDD